MIDWDLFAYCYSKTKIHVRHLFHPQLSGIKKIEEQILTGIPWENIAKNDNGPM